MVVLNMNNTQEPPITKTPTECMEDLLQAMLDSMDAAQLLLNAYPGCLTHVRWVAKEGDPGCCGAAVPVALLEKKVSALKARIINNPTVR